MFDDIEEFLDANGGVMTVSELALLAHESESTVRRWARENDVRRCGTTFVFGVDKALEFADDVSEELSDQDDDASGDDDDDDDDDDDQG